MTTLALFRRLMLMGELHVHEHRYAGGSVVQYDLILDHRRGGAPRKLCGTSACHRIPFWKRKTAAFGAGHLVHGRLRQGHVGSSESPL